ncbi:MAG TPA: hypothetical protein VHK88_05455 [Aquihabitans sp.]|jgi:hypothetical protein|nr:hypothetical protein [Aquihabitans sp.]
MDTATVTDHHGAPLRSLAPLPARPAARRPDALLRRLAIARAARTRRAIGRRNLAAARRLAEAQRLAPRVATG